MEAFGVVTETLTQPDAQTVVADGGNYTDNQVNTMLKAALKYIVDQMGMAFLVNFLSPNLQSKVMEKKPATMNACVKEAAETQWVILDKG